MSDSNVTKLALANSLKNLMAKRPFGRICVSDIAGDCGLTRQAFYYHFKDKYDLMNWIYETETARFIRINKDMGHCMDGLRDLCDYMRQNKTFYANALNTTGQNSFQEYLHESIFHIVISGAGSIDNTESEEKWSFYAEAIAVIFVGLTVRWANNGMKEDPVEYIGKLRSLFDGSLFHALEKQCMNILSQNLNVTQ